MVNEESRPDCRPGMDINTGDRVGMLCHDARQKRYSLQVQLMSQPVDADRKYCRICKDDFVNAFGSGITIEGGLYVVGQPGSQVCHLAQEKQGLLFGDFAAMIAGVIRALARWPDAPIDLLGQSRINRFEQISNVVSD